MISKCLLCQQDKALVRESHIIPSFMFKLLFVDKAKKKAALNIIDGNQPRKQIIQKMYFDQHILCYDCEALFNRLETYGAKAIRFIRKVVVKTHPDHGALIDGIEYRKFKSLIISIFWRCHISRNAYFQHFELGVEDAEQMRLMLLGGDAGSKQKFAVTISGLQWSDEHPLPVLTKPLRINKDGMDIVSLLAAGLLYTVQLKWNSSAPLADYALEPTQPFKVRMYDRETSYKLTGIQTNLAGS